MLTIFTIPKALEGHNGRIQHNALASWCALEPRPQVILCGNDSGVAEAAAKFQVEHLPDIPTTELGTPLLDAAFRRASEVARPPILCYVNADIIFLGELNRLLARIELDRFLVVGRRIDLDLTEKWDFSQPGTAEQLKEKAEHEGRLFTHYGIDYFIFPKGDPVAQLPPFAVGRPGWDNWFIGNAWKHDVPIIDATASITAIHQNHDYRHVPEGRKNTYQGPEGDENIALAKPPGRAFNIDDAAYLLTPAGIVRPPFRRYALTRLARWYHTSPHLYFCGRLFRILGGRIKRLFMAHTPDYAPPSFREQYRQLKTRYRNIKDFKSESKCSETERIREKQT